MIRFILLFFGLAAIMLASCNNINSGSSNSYSDSAKMLRLRGYEQANPSIVHLPETVGEISGMLYYPKDSSIMCIVDNEGILYKFPLYSRQLLQRWPYSSGSDFEEIILHDSIFYAVQSNGSITRLHATATGFIKNVYESSTSIKQREFEAAVYDTSRNLLLLVCKDCEDDSTNITSVWGYDPVADTVLPGPVFKIDQTQIEILLGYAIEKFKPSGAAIHPVTGDFYYVSAINDLVVVTDRTGIVKSVAVIDKVLFKQPEGICFKPNGDLLISNEFADVGRATILLYKYTADTSTIKPAPLSNDSFK